jgi:hypothetical protein
MITYKTFPAVPRRGSAWFGGQLLEVTLLEDPITSSTAAIRLFASDAGYRAACDLPPADQQTLAETIRVAVAGLVAGERTTLEVSPSPGGNVRRFPVDVLTDDSGQTCAILRGLFERAAPIGASLPEWKEYA